MLVLSRGSTFPNTESVTAMVCRLTWEASSEKSSCISDEIGQDLSCDLYTSVLIAGLHIPLNTSKMSPFPVQTNSPKVQSTKQPNPKPSSDKTYLNAQFAALF
jgi:hypothetical protein